MISEEELREAALASASATYRSVASAGGRYRFDPLKSLFPDKNAVVGAEIVTCAEKLTGTVIGTDKDVTARALCSILRRWARSQLVRHHR